LNDDQISATMLGMEGGYVMRSMATVFPLVTCQIPQISCHWANKADRGCLHKERALTCCIKPLH